MEKLKKLLCLVLSSIWLCACITGCDKNSTGSHQERRIGDESYIVLSDNYQDGLYDKEYVGEYDKQSATSSERKDISSIQSGCKILKYSEYVSLCKDWNIKQTYKDKELNYVVIASIADEEELKHIRLHDIRFTQSQIKIIYREEVENNASTQESQAEFIVIPVIAEITEIVGTKIVYEKEFDEIQNNARKGE